MWLDSKAVNCPQKWGNFKQTLDSTLSSMFCLLMRCVLLPLRAFRPWVLNQPGRILTAYAIYTPSDGSSGRKRTMLLGKLDESTAGRVP